jgi:TolB protein
MSEFEPGNDPFVVMPEPKNRPSGCRIFLTIFVVLALIGMSASGAIWYFFYREQPQPVQPDPIVEATAVPTESNLANEENEETEIESEPVATELALPTAESGATVNRIVYVNDRGQIIALGPDGSDERQLTDAQQRFQFPAWSPDGRSIAAIGVDRAGAGLFVLSDDSTEVAPVPLYADQNEGPFYLYWSPDSSQVSFLASHPDGMGLHLVQADGTADSRLLTIGGPLYWQWTADSQQMLIHSGFSGEASRLELITADGDGTGDAIAAPGFFQAPGISADGRYLAYAEENPSGSSRLAIVDIQTDAVEQQRHAGLVAMAWSPTANQLAFTNGSEPDSSSFVGPLRLMDAATGEVRLLSSEPIVAFFWSPDGRYLAALSISRSGEGDINAQAAKDVFGKLGRQQNLPRLRLLVYDVTTDEGRLLFSFVPTITFVTQFLPFFDQYALSHRLWSPDSSALVLPMVENGRNEIFIINVVSGQKQFLAEGSMPFWSPR